ncbi:MAG: CARDB domain-containing protein [Thermoplasmatales archaeon]|nr:CARDB domain-containing protein [Thermoplasmatales archaeon]
MDLGNIFTFTRALDDVRILSRCHYFYTPIVIRDGGRFRIDKTRYSPINDPYLDVYHAWYDLDNPIHIGDIVGGIDFYVICKPLPLPPPPPPPEAPDLIVAGISLCPQTPLSNHEAIINVTLKNVGTADVSGTVYISFWDEENQIGSSTISYIPMKGFSVSNISWTPTYSDIHAIKIVADPPSPENPNGLIEEGDESNNENTYSIQVFAPLEDYDNDGLINQDELYIYGTDLTKQNTDNDLLNDGDEINGWDVSPIGKASYHVNSDPKEKDTDNDGLDDYLEYTLGTDPEKVDTDEDGLWDGEEYKKGADPLNPDTDGDGLFDGNTNEVIELRITQIDVSSTFTPDPFLDDSIWWSDGEFYLLVGDNEVRYPKCYPYYWSISSGRSKSVNELIAVKYYQQVTITVMVRVWEDDLWWDDYVGTFTISVNGEGTITASNDKVTLHFTSSLSFFADPDPTSANADNDGMTDFYEVTYLSDRVFDFRVEDTDRDGLINLVDPDSDNDGLLDGPANNVIKVWLEKMHVIDDHDYIGAGEIYIRVDNVRYPSSGTWSINSGETKYLWIFARAKLLPCVVTVQVIVKEEDPFLEETIGTFTVYISGAGTATVGNSDVTLYFKSTKYPFWDPNPLRADTDGDGINDKDEINYLSDRVKNFLTADTDGDGTINYLDWDSDNDGLSDGIEINYAVDPLDSDSDNDGLIDGDEPYWNVDSDNDGLINALDPNSDNDGYPLDGSDPDPLGADTDADGLLDTAEDANGNGVWDVGETDPNNPDTDGDGVNDGTEPYWNIDSDNDGLINALDTDSDNDGLGDGVEDSDYDGMVGSGETNPLNPDTDSDTLLDGGSITISQSDNRYTFFISKNIYNVKNADDTFTFYGEQSLGTYPLSSDSDGDGSFDAVEVKFDTNPMGYEATLVKYDSSNRATDVIYPYTGWSETGNYRVYEANSNEPTWAPLAKELAPHMIYEDVNQEFPTSIFFDNNRDISNNGKPYDGVAYDPHVGGYNDPSVGDGYYNHDFNWKKQHTCVYMNVLKATDIASPYHELLGIQYWFYYPYHDCPSAGVHPHDWWYFWIVYDMNNHEPTKCYYDLHHNVRGKGWDTIYKDGFHPKVYVDAGGHRVMWSGKYSSVGVTLAEIPYVGKLKVGFECSEDNFFDIMIFLLSKGDVLPFDLSFKIETIFGSSSISVSDVLWYLGFTKTKQIVELILSIRGYSIPYPPLMRIADWRKNDHHFDEGVTLNVEDFSHWVYIYKTSAEENPDEDPALHDYQLSVGVGYEGDNIYNGDLSNYWPSKVKVNTEWKSTHLPWMEKLHHGDKTKDADHNVYEAWTWVEYDYQSQGEKAWRHNEYLTEAVWDYVYD